MWSFWNPDGTYISGNTGSGQSSLGSNTVALASIHAFDLKMAGCELVAF